jgi:3-hydroxybutyryl-CoA dehydrogenase
VEIRSVGVVGLGTMGAGIAQVALEAGFEVVGREVTPELGERARGRIEHFLTRKLEKGQLEATARDDMVARLRLTTQLRDLAGCDLVIEAVLEEPELKREVFGALNGILGRRRSSPRTRRRCRSPRSRPGAVGRSVSSACTSSTRRR